MNTAQPAPERTTGQKSLLRWMIASTAITGGALPLAYVLLVVLDTWAGFRVDLTGIGFWASIFAAIPAASLLSVWLVRTPREQRLVVKAAILGAFAGAAPISSVLFFRVQYNTCSAINIFGLPWAEPLPLLTQVATALVYAAAVVFIVVALFSRSLRPSAFAMVCWLLIAIVPSFLLFFISIYGDPGFDCIPR